MNHIGGDGFWLIREPSGRVRAIMGAGRAGAKATRQLYRDAGHHEIPARGPLAALTVPGAVATWMLAIEAAKAQTGKGTRAKLPLHVLFEAAIKHARAGYTRDAQPGAADGGKIAGDEGCRARLQGSLPGRRQGAGGGRRSSSRPPSPPRSSNSRKPGSTISIAAMSAARSPPTWNASAAR